MAVELTLAAIALFGHGVLWVGINNRLHAMPFNRAHVKAISALLEFGMLAVPVTFAWWMYRERMSVGEWHLTVQHTPIALFYVVFCIGIAAVHFPRWLYVRFVALRRAGRHGRRLCMLDVTRRLGRYPSHGFQFAVGRHVPFNQTMQIEFVEKEVPLKNLPLRLDGLRIVHLTDLHLSGRVDPGFFHEVVFELNAMDPDLVLLTGDIVDKANCLPWIGEILSPIRAQYGKFFILGNHDDRLSDIPKLRDEVSAAGFNDLGGRWHHLSINGQTILLAGNELPWFRPAPRDDDVPDRANCDESLKILLSHSPDQLQWARRRHFDLMLCGHTHGGQIRFPLIGPVVCPSWYGVRYASGLFLEIPTAIHVSRGLSGLFPIRWNCYPEIALLVLRSGSTGQFD